MANKNCKAKHGQQGFTLIEILVALFIFVIVVTTIFGSYNSVFSNAESIKDDMTSYEMAKNCLNRMIIDLQSLHVSLPPAYSMYPFSTASASEVITY